MTRPTLSVDELDALPDLTVVLDFNRMAYQKSEGDWWLAYNWEGAINSDEIYGAHVIYNPDED